MDSIGWRVFYSDNSVYDQHALELPSKGVVCVVVYYDEEWGPGRPYRDIVSGGDWYWQDNGQWKHSGTGEWGRWLDMPHPDALQSAERLPPDLYESIIEEAHQAVEAP